MTVEALLEKVRNGTIPTTDSSITTHDNTLVLQGLDNYDCDICGNRGYIPHTDGPCGSIYEERSCMKKRKSLRRLKNRGLEQLAEKYRLDNYNTDNESSANLLSHAKQYLEDPSPKWFFVSGIPGSGKSHLCTALAVEFINRGSDVYYMRWREESVRLKKAISEDSDAYEERMSKLKQAEVLYIDDFLKGSVSDADIKLAFELLDYRYGQKNSRTILSTEYPMPALRKIDDAIARRIFERAKGYCCASPDRNYSFTR